MQVRAIADTLATIYAGAQDARITPLAAALALAEERLAEERLAEGRG